MRDLDAIIKAYDVRGVYPDQLDEDLSRAVGGGVRSGRRCICGSRRARAVVVGHDMRPSGPDLVAAFADGVTAQGVDVVEIGLCSTDGLYFASGHLGLPGRCSPKPQPGSSTTASNCPAVSGRRR